MISDRHPIVFLGRIINTDDYIHNVLETVAIPYILNEKTQFFNSKFLRDSQVTVLSWHIVSTSLLNDGVTKT